MPPNGTPPARLVTPVVTRLQVRYPRDGRSAEIYFVAKVTRRPGAETIPPLFYNRECWTGIRKKRVYGTARQDDADAAAIRDFAFPRSDRDHGAGHVIGTWALPPGDYRLTLTVIEEDEREMERVTAVTRYLLNVLRGGSPLAPLQDEDGAPTAPTGALGLDADWLARANEVLPGARAKVANLFLAIAGSATTLGQLRDVALVVLSGIDYLARQNENDFMGRASYDFTVPVDPAAALTCATIDDLKALADAGNALKLAFR